MLFQFYGGSSLQEVFYYLEQWGISEIILPFILIFTVIYAVLMKIALFKGEDGKAASPRFNGVIALAIALMTVIPHALGKYPADMDVVVIINTALPEIVLLIIAVVMLLIMTGLSLGKGTLGVGFSGVIAIIAGLILVGIFLSAMWPIPFISNIDPALKTLIVAILVFALVFWYVTKPEKGGKGIKDWMKEIFE